MTGSDPNPPSSPPEPAPSLDDLRRRCRAVRRGLDHDRRAAATSRIEERLLSLPELAGPGRLGLSLPTDGEVDLAGAVPELVARGWRLHLPVTGPDHAMAFRSWEPGAPLEPGRYGIPVPTATDGSGDVDAAALDVVVVPCVAVDRAGRRLGFGAGYYDRALAGAARSVLVAVAFAEQVVDGLEDRDHDVPVHVVVTDAEVVRPR